MRLDGELMRDNGAAVNWREFHTGAGEVLVEERGLDRLARPGATSFPERRYHDRRPGI